MNQTQQSAEAPAPQVTKLAICNALRAWVNQRPGLEYGNYCSGWNDKAGRAAYFAEMRQITKDRADALTILRYVELRDSITAEMLIAAFPRAYSGRLTLDHDAKGRMRLDYCTGQYWATEYRKAACAVLASAVWDWFRTHCMPEDNLVHNSETGETFKRYDGLRAGDYIRRAFRREFGRSLASAYFN